MLLFSGGKDSIVIHLALAVPGHDVGHNFDEVIAT